MRTLACVGVVVVVLLLLGIRFVPGLGSHLEQWPRDIGQQVDESVSDPHLGGMVDKDLNDAEKELRVQYAKVYSAKLKVAEFEAAAKNQRAELASENRILERARELLKANAPGSIVKIGPTKFNWDELNEDALNRVHNCQMLRRKLEANEQSLIQLQQGVNNSLKVIAEQRDRIRQERMQVDLEKVELAALRSQEEIRRIVDDIPKGGDVKQNLGHAREVLKKRLNDLRAGVEYDQMTSSKSSTIPWNQELGIAPKAAVDSIDAYFNQGVPDKESREPESEGQKST